MNTVRTEKFFPLSSRYDEQWVRTNSLGENVLFNLESLCEVIEIEPGMRVLDLGSGKAISAIFLAREFGVKVWAVDSEMCPTSNYKRICEMDCEESVVPLMLDAKHLPFPLEYFDLIIAVDSFNVLWNRFTIYRLYCRLFETRWTDRYCRYLLSRGAEFNSQYANKK